MDFSQGMNLGDSISPGHMETRGRDSILMPSIQNVTFYFIILNGEKIGLKIVFLSDISSQTEEIRGK